MRTRPIAGRERVASVAANGSPAAPAGGPAAAAAPVAPAVARYGDVSVLELPSGPRLAVACDSLGAIGPKEHDRVRVPGYVVGRFACRVPLMELLALGAGPFLVVCALCVEPEPAGAEIIRGARDELVAAGLDPAAALTGSTEKNVPTSQTGVGVTALGIVGDLRWGRGRPGDLVVAVGRPKVGAAVRLDDPELADIPALKAALACPACGDAVPVGSRGIGAEARDLARRSGCGFVAAAEPGVAIDLEASAGPATCFLVTVSTAGRADLMRRLAALGRPTVAIGCLERVEHTDAPKRR